MSVVFAGDNIYLNGGTLLGSASSKILGACLHQDGSSNCRIFIANDENGLAGYDFGNHTLYGPQESGASWLQYDTGKIVSIDCAPVQYGNYLVLACNTGRIASFDGTSWKYPDGTGSGTGPYNSGSAVGDRKITVLLEFDSVLVIGAEDGRIASWNGSTWTNHDATSGLRSNGDMLGRRAIRLMAALGTMRLFAYEDSGRAFMWDTSASQWTAVNLNLEAGDSEIASMLRGCADYPLFYGTEYGKIAYWGLTGCHASSTVAISTARACSLALFEEDVVVGGGDGTIASLDGVVWKNADGTGSGCGVHTSGDPVSGSEVVSVIGIRDKVYLIARDKVLATGDVGTGTWHHCDGATSSLSYLGRVVPHYMIALFPSTPGAGWQVCNGDRGIPDLSNMNDLFPRGQAAQGAPTGSHTHQHASLALTTGGAAGVVGNGSITNTACRSSHTHSAAHQHEPVDHQPPFHELIPAVPGGAPQVPVDTILLWDGTTGTIPAGWSYWSSAAGRWLKFCTVAAGGSKSISAHTHSYSGNSGTSAPVSMQSGWNLFFAYWCCNDPHVHSIAHSHTACPNVPPSLDLIPIKSDLAASEIPSGVIAFFLGGVAPGGWSFYSAAHGRFIRLNSTAGGTSGSIDVHSHASQSFGSGEYDDTSELRTNAGASCAHSAHAHSFAHGHSDAQPIVPRHIPLLICRKD